MKKKKALVSPDKVLLHEVSALIEQGYTTVFRTTNSTLTLLFWNVGRSINKFILKDKRATYGKQIVVTLSRQLSKRFGRNFEEKNLRRMLQFAEMFPKKKIVVTLSRQLSWSHILLLLPIKTEEQRLYYAQLVAQEQIGVRALRKQIAQKAFERTAIANTQLPAGKHQLANVFKDPYLFDFLSLPSGYLEFDLETAILKELEKFILEVGSGFAFIERQKRMIIDGEDHYLDLLFFHRRLKRLVAIELKIGKFQAKHKGQMELYLKWLNKHERQEDEGAPVGLILCAETSREQIELLEMHKDGIMVAEYWTDLPPRKALEERLHQAYREAKELLERRMLSDE